MPTTDIGCQSVRFGGPPRSGLVLVDRCGVVEDGFYDRPGGFDDIFADEERRVTVHGIHEQPLVGIHFIALWLLDHRELSGIEVIASPGFLMSAEIERQLGTEPESNVVACRA